uniref:Uncharacterized protein n=1 Tax=Rhizophagus irregularis (strain DAOM 181602 / DAOM 197198 / MUCL 43194) TaxID=747089 RepID=U9TFE1_RHIID
MASDKLNVVIRKFYIIIVINKQSCPSGFHKVERLNFITRASEVLSKIADTVYSLSYIQFNEYVNPIEVGGTLIA